MLPIFDDSVTVPPDVARLLPLASLAWTVIARVVPEARLVSAVVIVVVAGAAAPGTVVMVTVMPLAPADVAVTVPAAPDAVDVSRVTVAMPLASVVEGLAEVNEPGAVLVQVTETPDDATGLPSASRSCALMTTLLPATGLTVAGVTR